METLAFPKEANPTPSSRIDFMVQFDHMPFNYTWYWCAAMIQCQCVNIYPFIRLQAFASCEFKEVMLNTQLQKVMHKFKTDRKEILILFVQPSQQTISDFLRQILGQLTISDQLQHFIFFGDSAKTRDKKNIIARLNIFGHFPDIFRMANGNQFSKFHLKSKYVSCECVVIVSDWNGCKSIHF